MKRYEAYKNSGIEWIGEIPEGWMCLPMKRGLVINNGKDYKDVQSEDGFPVIGSGGQFAFASKYLYDGEAVLLGRKGTIDKPMYINGKFWTVDTMFYTTPRQNVVTKYMYYQALTIPFGKYSTNTALPSMTQSDLADNPMCFPSLEEQKTIAAYLDHKVGQIDKSISEIDSQIESLKTYRQSIISESVTKGLGKNAKMKDSGIEWIGEIPEGWNVIPMKHYFYMKGRIGWQGLKADEFMEEGPYLVTGTDFKNGRVNWNTCYHITEERYQEAPEIHVHKGDVLITKDGTIGKLAYIDEKPEKVSLNSHLLILRPTKDVIDNYFVFWSLQSSAFKHYSGLASSGSTMASLSQEKIGAYFMALPPVDEQYAIAKYLENKTAQIDVAINALDAQKIDLKALKQAVISEAVTGKIDVRDWTPSVE